MRRISRLAAFVAGAVLTAAFLPGAAVAADGSQMSDGGHGDNELLRASVAGSLPTDPALFGVRPGGAPWTIDRGTVTLRADGRLDVKTDDLIIPTTGVNPLPTLAASVVCNGVVVATTATVPFSASGGRADPRDRDAARSLPGAGCAAQPERQRGRLHRGDWPGGLSRVRRRRGAGPGSGIARAGPARSTHDSGHLMIESLAGPRSVRS